MQNNCRMLRYFFVYKPWIICFYKAQSKIPMWAIMQKLVFGEHSYHG